MQLDNKNILIIFETVQIFLHNSGEHMSKDRERGTIW